jgi:hypothetical protein
MYFRGKRKVFDGDIDVARYDVPKGRIQLPRSGIYQGQAETDWTQIALTILNHTPPDATFFLDTSFIGRRDLPNAVWDALTTRRVVFTRNTWLECEDWFRTPYANHYFHLLVTAAKTNGSDHIVWLDTTKWDDTIRASGRYYITLLGARRLIGDRLRKNFLANHGREPSDEELRGRIQGFVGDRGFGLAWKGIEEIKRQKKYFFADDQLIVLAVIDAILSGRETYIWTQDPDVIEQFYKMVSMLDAHYGAFHLAKHYQRPGTVKTEQTIRVRGRLAEWIQPPEILSVFFHEENIREAALPPAESFVPICCQRFVDHGNRWGVQNLTFGAEQEMRDVLEIKGVNAGLNTLDLNGRNLHIVFAPPFPEGMGGRVFIVNDVTTEFKQMTLACLDVHYSQVQFERFGLAKISDSPLII